MQIAHPIEIERADVASPRATQWTDCAQKPAAPKSRPDLATAMRAANVQDMTVSFFAYLLDDS